MNFTLWGKNEIKCADTPKGDASPECQGRREHKILTDLIQLQ